MCLTPHSMSFCIALISDFVEVFRFGIFFLHCPGRLAHSVIQMKSITMDHADLALSVCYVRNSTCALTFCTSGDIFWNDNCLLHQEHYGDFIPFFANQSELHSHLMSFLLVLR
jgi:hypothetical protein